MWFWIALGLYAASGSDLKEPTPDCSQVCADGRWERRDGTCASWGIIRRIDMERAKVCFGR